MTLPSSCSPEYPSDQVKVLGQSVYLQHLFTVLRDKSSPTASFVWASDQIGNLLAQDLAELLPPPPLKWIDTPLAPVEGRGWFQPSDLFLVSILRGGSSMEAPMRSVFPGISVGKILIQRDEETCLPSLFYSKMPKKLLHSKCKIILVDPMLATGGSALMALKEIEKEGVEVEERVVLVNVVVAPEGLKNVLESFPKLQILAGCVDSGLNEKKYILPGLGDYGCRYFGTEE